MDFADLAKRANADLNSRIEISQRPNVIESIKSTLSGGLNVVPALKLCRNLCAQNALGQDALIAANIHLLVLDILPSDEPDNLLFAMQCLANMITGNLQAQELIFQLAFNDLESIKALILLEEHPQIQQATAIFIHNALQNSTRNMEILTFNLVACDDPVAITLCGFENSTNDSSDDGNELCWIWSNILRSAMFSSLHGKVLQGLLERRYYEHCYCVISLVSCEMEDEDRAMMTPAISSTLTEIAWATANYLKDCPADDNVRLKCLLESTRLLCGMLSNVSIAIQEEELERMIKALLDLMYTLTLTYPRRTAKTEQTIAEIESCPVHGMKRDILKLICHLVHGNAHVQNYIREIEGLAVILECCNIDDNNPYMKEWAVVCIRHLCENNADNQEFIRQLKLKQAVQSAEMNEMGMKARVDENGKLLLEPATTTTSR